MIDRYRWRRFGMARRSHAGASARRLAVAATPSDDCRPDAVDMGRREAAAERPRLGRRRGVLPDLSRAIPQRRSLERSDARLAGIPRARAASRGRFRPGPAIGTPAPIGKRSAAPNFFENGVFNRRYGGDLQGVIDKLDYLDELGINAIYFNPVSTAARSTNTTGRRCITSIPTSAPTRRAIFKLIAAETSDPEVMALDGGRQAVS